VPFGPAISIYVHSCNGSFQELLGYYRLSPQVFLISPDGDFRCPENLAAPYEWQRRGGQEALVLGNRQYLDLLALKLSTEFLHCPTQEFTARSPEFPLRILRGHPVVRGPAPAERIRAERPAPTAASSVRAATPGAARAGEFEPPAVIVGEDGAHRLMRGTPGFTTPVFSVPVAPQPIRSSHFPQQPPFTGLPPVVPGH